MDSEIIDISNLNDDLNDLKSVNFGGGIELLMNDKAKDGKSKSKGFDHDISLDDLNKLENELNELSDTTNSFNIDSGSSSYTPKSDIFSASPSGPLRGGNWAGSTWLLVWATTKISISACACARRAGSRPLRKMCLCTTRAAPVFRPAHKRGL